MSITTCQKVTLISCSVLCVSLFLPRMLLPRAKKEMGQPQVGPGFYPPGMHQLPMPEDSDQWGLDAMTHNTETTVKVKGIVRGNKYNLMAQVIPIYGFGILLYILYIIHKLTCRGKATKTRNYTTMTHMEMTDHELAQLQERLLQTERMMERIVSRKSRTSGSGKRRKSKTSTSKKEEKLLRQLRQITQLMQEGRLEGASPEMEAEEVPYGADWEGYLEETYPEYEACFDKHGFHTFTLEEPTNQPTAEALAERMLQEEEEVMARKLSIVREEDEEEEEGDEEEEEDEDEEEEEEDTEEEEEELEAEAEKRLLLGPSLSESAAEGKQERCGLEVSRELQCLSGGKKQISFNDHKDVFHYPKEDTYEREEEEAEEEEEEEEEDEEDEEREDELEEEEAEVVQEEEVDEDDPVMEAESLQFGGEGCSNPEEEAEEEGKEEDLLTSAPVEAGDVHLRADVPKDVGVSGLRMRNRREK
ncbi:protein RIC-3 [Aulostomus maculatus]